MKITTKQAYVLVLLFAAAIFVGSCLISAGQLTLQFLSQEKNVYTAPGLPAFDYHQDFSRNTYLPLIRLENKDRRFFCSATVISNEYALTAAHCLMDRGFFTGGMRTDTFYAVSQTNTGEAPKLVEVTAAALAQGADYALIRGDFKLFTKARVNARSSLPEEVLTPIINCGFPYGSKAVCYGMGDTPSQYIFQWAINGIMFPGMSGGPVVDSQGVVFAVNCAVLQGGVLISPLIGMFEALGIKVLND